MPIVAANGLLILLPCAVFLQRCASIQQFDGWFVPVQLLELGAGAINVTLLALSARDGLHLRDTSALIDAGDPARLDPDGTRTDIGAYATPPTAAARSSASRTCTSRSARPPRPPRGTLTIASACMPPGFEPLEPFRAWSPTIWKHPAA